MVDQDNKKGNPEGGEVRGRLAQKARRRIELIASRIPGARALVKHAPPEAEADRLVVVSDMHFGNDYGALNTAFNRKRLIDGIRALGQVDELVLLGDVFDFWTTSLSNALEQSRELIGALFKLENVGRMIYIPGNHDHHVVRLYHAEQVSARLRRPALRASQATITPPIGISHSMTNGYSKSSSKDVPRRTGIQVAQAIGSTM